LFLMAMAVPLQLRSYSRDGEPRGAHLMMSYLMITHQAAFLANSHNKKRLIQALREKMQDYDQLDTFTTAASSHEEVKTAGESFILKLYGASKFQSLDEYCHIAYKRAIEAPRGAHLMMSYLMITHQAAFFANSHNKEPLNQ